jgi:hypothetical protein
MQEAGFIELTRNFRDGDEQVHLKASVIISVVPGQAGTAIWVLGDISQYAVKETVEEIAAKILEVT